MASFWFCRKVGGNSILSLRRFGNDLRLMLIRIRRFINVRLAELEKRGEGSPERRARGRAAMGTFLVS
jgi:hypothetical protein